MLARSNKIIHPLGTAIETPLLVPSFSSKGFSLVKSKSITDVGKRKTNSKSKKINLHSDISEVFEALEVSQEFLTESLLISGYDIFYNHIPFTEDHICTELTIIDSGGYETGVNYDLSSTSKFNYDIKPWSVKKLERVLNKWPKHKAAITVSYDHGNLRIPLVEQIASAKELFSRFPKMLSDFLVKPEAKSQIHINIDNLIPKINDLKYFEIIGVTEKELGDSILQRMLNISKIRMALDHANNAAPLHIFGSLDPITSILYFLAGAEIFDGLTWLKYTYHVGVASYPSNYGVLNDELGIHVRDGQVKSKSMVNNLYYLEKMKYTMKDFLHNHDFGLFDRIAYNGFGQLIEKSYNTYKSNIK